MTMVQDLDEIEQILAKLDPDDAADLREQIEDAERSGDPLSVETIRLRAADFKGATSELDDALDLLGLEYPITGDEYNRRARNLRARFANLSRTQQHALVAQFNSDPAAIAYYSERPASTPASDLMEAVDAELGKTRLSQREKDRVRDNVRGLLAGLDSQAQARLVQQLAEPGALDDTLAGFANQAMLESAEKRRDVIEQAFRTSVLLPMKAALAGLGPSAQAVMNLYITRMEGLIPGLHADYEAHWSGLADKQGDMMADVLGPSSFLKKNLLTIMQSARPGAVFGGFSQTGETLESQVRDFVDLSFAAALQGAQNAERLKSRLNAIEDQLANIGLETGLDADGKAELARLRQVVKDARGRREADYAIDPAQNVDDYLNAAFPLELASGLLGSDFATAVTPGNAVGSVTGILSMIGQRQQQRQTARAEADREAGAAIIRQAHAANPDFDLDAALESYAAQLRANPNANPQSAASAAMTQSRSAQAAVTGPQEDQLGAALTERIRDAQTALDSGELNEQQAAEVRQYISNLQRSQPQLTGLFRQWLRGQPSGTADAFLAFMPAANLPAGIVPGTQRARQNDEMSRGLTAALGSQLSFTPDGGAPAKQFTPSGVFGEQAVGRLSALLRPSVFGGVRPFKFSELSEALSGKVSDITGEDAQAHEARQRVGRTSQLLEQMARQRGIDTTRDLTDTRAIQDLLPELSQSLFQSDESIQNVYAAGRAEFARQQGVTAQQKAQEELIRKKERVQSPGNIIVRRR